MSTSKNISAKVITRNNHNAYGCWLLFITVTILTESNAQSDFLKSLTSGDIEELFSRDVYHGSEFWSKQYSKICETMMCYQGTVCRVIKDCQLCFPVARCVRPDQIPLFADTVCQRRNYEKALLTTTGSSFYLTGFSCSRSVNSCPAGSSCVAGFGGKSQCCFGSKNLFDTVKFENIPFAKLGSCPKMGPGSPRGCGGTICLSEDSCPGRQICCPSGCGMNLCTNPDITFRRSEGCGHCPSGTICREGPALTFRCVAAGVSQRKPFQPCSTTAKLICGLKTSNSIDACSQVLQLQCSDTNLLCWANGLPRPCGPRLF